MPTSPVTDLGAAVATGVAAALALFFSGIPKLIAFAALLIVGWIVASLIASAIRGALRALHFNELAAKVGLAALAARVGMPNDLSRLTADVVKWIVRVVFIGMAFDALGLPAISDSARALILFLPNLVVAIVLLVIAALAANAVRPAVAAAVTAAGLASGELLGRVAAGVVLGFGVLLAMSQLGIATMFVTALFVGLVAATALALGLAFGLGGRDAAARIIEGASPPMGKPFSAPLGTGNGHRAAEPGAAERAATPAD